MISQTVFKRLLQETRKDNSSRQQIGPARDTVNGSYL
jgi:hypothetical protein